MTSYDGPLLAAPRDASCVARPNIRTPKQVHVAVNVAEMPGYYGEDPILIGDAACAPARMPLDMHLADRAERWPITVRCQRSACRSRWSERTDSHA